MEGNIFGCDSDENAIIGIDYAEPALNTRSIQRDGLLVARLLVARQRERPDSRRLIISDDGFQSRTAGPISLYSRLVEMIPTAIVCAA